MSAENLTVEILKQIRADLAETNRSLSARMDMIEERHAASDKRIEATQGRLVEAEIRLATELLVVSKTMGEVRDLLR